MSSPGTSKTSRPMSTLTKDYHSVVSEMENNNLLRSTLTDDCRTKKGDQKTCLLWGLSYFWRPIHCRTHLGLAGSTKQVQLCKPYPEHCDHFSEVVRELKERHTQTEHTVREVTKRSLESVTPGDAIIVQNFCKKACVSNDRPFKIVRTRDEVDIQWARLPCRLVFPWAFSTYSRRRYSRLLPRMDSSSSDLTNNPRWSGSRYKLLCAWLCHFLSDDEGGVPHDVFDSESESENDSD